MIENYREELRLLQTELVKLQNWVQAEGQRVLVIIEGRDTAGKGGAIRRFTRYLNPRSMRAVALPKPTEYEKGQWYFQRYIIKLPSAGEIVFFDRSWYNRAVVEPTMGFCTKSEYDIFIQQVPLFEKMLFDDGIIIFKFWFSIDIKEQKKRLVDREINPLKQWKLSTIDIEAQQKWNLYTKYKEEMFEKTHTPYSPWIIIDGNNKQRARLESIRYVLSRINYKGKSRRANLFKIDQKILRLYN